MYKAILNATSMFEKLSQINKLAKTLYHGTSINRARQIAEQDLIPQVGDWVSSTYLTHLDIDEENYDETNAPILDLVFASDKKTIQMAVGGMKAAIAAELGKEFHDVTEEDILALGAIVVIKDGEEYFKQRPSRHDSKAERNWFYYEDGGRYPTVEPEDYYSEESVPASYIISGKPLLRLLKRYEAWPEILPYDSRGKKEKLIKHHVMKNPDDRDNIVERIKNLTDAELEDEFVSEIGYS